MPDAPRIVVLRRTGEPCASFALDAGAAYVFGSGDACDVRIQLATVAEAHCRIAPDGAGGALLEGLASYGTVLNGASVGAGAAIALAHGDVLTVVERSFRFECPRAATAERSACDSISASLAGACGGDGGALVADANAEGAAEHCGGAAVQPMETAVESVALDCPADEKPMQTDCNEALAATESPCDVQVEHDAVSGHVECNGTAGTSEAVCGASDAQQPTADESEVQSIAVNDPCAQTHDECVPAAEESEAVATGTPVKAAAAAPAPQRQISTRLPEMAPMARKAAPATPAGLQTPARRVLPLGSPALRTPVAGSRSATRPGTPLAQLEAPAVAPAAPHPLHSCELPADAPATPERQMLAAECAPTPVLAAASRLSLGGGSGEPAVRLDDEIVASPRVSRSVMLSPRRQDEQPSCVSPLRSACRVGDGELALGVADDDDKHADDELGVIGHANAEESLVLHAAKEVNIPAGEPGNITIDQAQAEVVCDAPAADMADDSRVEAAVDSTEQFKENSEMDVEQPHCTESAAAREERAMDVDQPPCMQDAPSDAQCGCADAEQPVEMTVMTSDCNANEDMQAVVENEPAEPIEQRMDHADDGAAIADMITEGCSDIVTVSSGHAVASNGEQPAKFEDEKSDLADADAPASVAACVGRDAVSAEAADQPIVPAECDDVVCQDAPESPFDDDTAGEDLADKSADQPVSLAEANTLSMAETQAVSSCTAGEKAIDCLNDISVDAEMQTDILLCADGAGGAVQTADHGEAISAPITADIASDCGAAAMASAEAAPYAFDGAIEEMEGGAQAQSQPADAREAADGSAEREVKSETPQTQHAEHESPRTKASHKGESPAKGGRTPRSRHTPRGRSKSPGRGEDEKTTLHAAGQAAAAVRWARARGDDQAAEAIRSESHEQLAALGRRGAAARWSQEEDASRETYADDFERSGDVAEEEDTEDSTHERLRQAGRKGMARRIARARESEGLSSEGEMPESMHTRLSDAGKKGAARRWSKAHEPDEGEDAGKGAGDEQLSAQEETHSRDKAEPTNSDSTHEKLAEAGRRGIGTRIARARESEGLSSEGEMPQSLREKQRDAGKKGAEARWAGRAAETPKARVLRGPPESVANAPQGNVPRASRRTSLGAGVGKRPAPEALPGGADDRRRAVRPARRASMGPRG